MACTKALSNFSCSAPALPGLINSLWIESTLGGGVVSCAAAMPSPPTSTHVPNSNPVILFMDADLLGREIDWIQIWKGSDPRKRKRNPQLRGEYPSVTTEVKPKAIRRPWIAEGHGSEDAGRPSSIKEKAA